MALTFLTLDEVLAIHTDQIARYGGSGGVRDLELLESAIMQPQATFDGQFLHADFPQMAAAYLFHIVRNHPFVDGNKRAGTAAAEVFLIMNGIEFVATDDELYDTVIAVAKGEFSKSQLAHFIRQNCEGLRSIDNPGDADNRPEELPHE